jgi:hypothetical protein
MINTTNRDPQKEQPGKLKSDDRENEPRRTKERRREFCGESGVSSSIIVPSSMTVTSGLAISYAYMDLTL